MTGKCSEAAREVLEHLLLLEELESDCLLVLPYLLEHQCLSLCLTSLLGLDMSLSCCLSVLLLGKSTLLLCKCLENLCKRVWHCYLSYYHWRRCRGPSVVAWCSCPGCTGVVVVSSSNGNCRSVVLVVLGVL